MKLLIHSFDSKLSGKWWSNNLRMSVTRGISCLSLFNSKNTAYAQSMFRKHFNNCVMRNK